MSTYAGSCQDLGFVCDWQVIHTSRQDVVASLVDHLNRVHETGSTSPTLSALIDRHVTESRPGTPAEPTHTQEHTS